MIFFNLKLMELNIELFILNRNISVKKGGYGVEIRGISV